MNLNKSTTKVKVRRENVINHNLSTCTRTKTRDEEKRKLTEHKRKLFHLAVLILPGLLLLGFSREVIVILFTVLVILVFPLEYYRINYPEFFLNQFARKSEIGRMGTYVPYIIAGYLIYLFFDWRITTYALLITALGDAGAAIIGTNYGKHRLPLTKHKSVEGTLAAFGVSFLVILLLALIDRSVIIHPLAMLAPLIVVATDFIEAPPHNFLSDNFLNPILCGLFFWIIGIPPGCAI
ncbi:MAG: diacylglycerol/polyprenol kinase family protein [Candidatus Heimdallarchaeota archaeon]